MIRTVQLALFAALLLVAPVAFAEPVDKTVNVSNEDAEMNAAIAKARASLPVFWEAHANPAPNTENYGLKVKITDGENVEHFWTNTIERADGKIFAIIANEPEFVKTVTYGQRIEVPEADISDWMFFRNGKIVGGETLRVLLGRMSPEEKAASGLDELVFETP